MYVKLRRLSLLVSNERSEADKGLIMGSFTAHTFTPEIKSRIEDYVYRFWEGVSKEHLFETLNIDTLIAESQFNEALKELEENGIIRYDNEGLLRKGCDIRNEKYKDKVKVFKVKSSECSQWIICNTYEEAVTVAGDELSMFDLGFFDRPFSASVEIQVDWLGTEEYDLLKEHDGC